MHHFTVDVPASDTWLCLECLTVNRVLNTCQCCDARRPERSSCLMEIDGATVGALPLDADPMTRTELMESILRLACTAYLRGLVPSDWATTVVLEKLIAHPERAGAYMQRLKVFIAEKHVARTTERRISTTAHSPLCGAPRASTSTVAVSEKTERQCGTGDNAPSHPSGESHSTASVETHSARL